MVPSIAPAMKSKIYSPGSTAKITICRKPCFGIEGLLKKKSKDNHKRIRMSFSNRSIVIRLYLLAISTQGYKMISEQSRQ